MLDSRASHNLMPKVVLEKLGLEITRPYHDLFSFDAKKVKCIGLIKDLVISLTQLSMKSVMIDVVIADIPANYGMLLSRAWTTKVGGNLQMDMSFATVLVFGGEEKRLYRENKLQYVVSKNKKARNHPVYTKDESLECFGLSANPDFEDEENTKANFDPEIKAPQISEGDVIDRWKLCFDGTCSKRGTEAGVCWLEPEGMTSPTFSMLPFDFTNNDAKWEELTSEEEEGKVTKAWDIDILPDYDLAVQQVSKSVQNEHSSMNVSNTPSTSWLQHEVEMLYHPSISEDVRPCQVIEGIPDEVFLQNLDGSASIQSSHKIQYPEE